MSSSLSEFLNAWNETMPLQIRESDIKNPTENVLRRLLISMLKQFYVDTTFFENMDNENGSRLKASRVKLVATVNLFYKIAFPGAKQDFFFMDLIQPNFKKSFNVLNYLLNYCVFIRHTYNTTIGVLKDQIAERDELRSIKNQLRKEIEESKIREENNIKGIKEYDSKIPRQRAKLAELQENSMNLRNEMSRLEIDTEKMEMRLIETKNELCSIKTISMTDQEMESIVSAKETIEKQLEEQDQITFAGRQKLKENAHAIDEALVVTTKMEALQSSFSNIDASGIKSQKTQVENLELEVNALKSSISENSATVKQLSQSLEFKQKSLAQLNKKRDKVHSSYANKNAEQKKEMREKENMSRKLSIQELTLASTNQRLSKEQDLTFKLASNVLKHISNTIFKDNQFEN